MSEEPFYIRQAVVENDAAREWFVKTIDEACALGAKFYRASYHPDQQKVKLVEGWYETPADQGEIRWQFAAGEGS